MPAHPVYNSLYHFGICSAHNEVDPLTLARSRQCSILIFNENIVTSCYSFLCPKSLYFW